MFHEKVTTDRRTGSRHFADPSALLAPVVQTASNKAEQPRSTALVA